MVLNNSSSTCRSFMVLPHDFIRSPTITKYHLANNNNNNNHHIKFSAVAVSTSHHKKKKKKQYHGTRILDDLRISCRAQNHQSTAAILIPHDHVCCPSDEQFNSINKTSLSSIGDEHDDEDSYYKVGAAAGSSTLVLPIRSEGTVPLLVQSSSIGSSAVEQKWVLKEGRKVAVMGYGGAALVQSCLTAAAILTVHGLSITVADAAAAAVDDHRDLIWSLAQHHQLLLTVEEEASNSSSRSRSIFGSQVSRFLSSNSNGLLHPHRLKWRGMTLPVPEEHSKGAAAAAAAAAAGGLNSKHIASTVLSLISDHQDVFLIM